jgi:hypothetical protein
MAIPGMSPAGPALVTGPAQLGHLVLQEARGNQEPQLDGQALQGVLHQAEQFVPIRGS